MSASPPRSPLPRLRRPAEAALFDVLASGGSSGYAHVVVTTPGLTENLDWAAAWTRLIAAEPVLTTAANWRGLPRPVWSLVEPCPPVVLRHEGDDPLQILERWFDGTHPELERDPLVRSAVLVNDLEFSLGLSYCPAACDEHLAARILAGWIKAATDSDHRPAARPWPVDEDDEDDDPEATKAFWIARLRESGTPLPLAVDRRTANLPRHSHARVVRIPLASSWDSPLTDRTLAALSCSATEFGAGARPTVGYRSQTAPASIPTGRQSLLPLCIPNHSDFESMVAAARSARVDALVRSNVSSRTLHHWSGLHRDVELTPVVLNCWSGDPSRELTDVVSAASPQWTLVARHPIEISVYPGADHFELRFHPQRFDEAEAVAFAEATASRLFPAKPARTTPAGRTLALQNGASLTAPHSVLDQVRAYARERPQAPAIVGHHRRVTYGELESRAQGIAGRLQDEGVGQGDFVVVASEQQFDVAIALVAIAWVGAVAVPLDITPDASELPEWLASHPKVWIWGSAKVNAALRSGPSLRASVHFIDAARPPSRAGPPPAVCEPDALAYAIHTSGSTGPSKPVLCSHGALGISIAARRSTYSDAAPERMLLTLSTAFDGGLGCVWWALTSGAALHILPTASKSDAAMWPPLIEERAITHLMTLPPLYESCLRGNVGEQLRSLRAVSVGGERCPADLVALHFSAAAQAQLVNEYGPSEAVVWATAHRCEPGSRVVPIGHLRAGLSGVIAFDDDITPAPGAVGELVLSGDALARGYAGPSNPPLRSRGAAQAPTFRTGDRVAARADGTLVFVGRLDGQHKHAGRNIDLARLGELIAAHPTVADAHVMLVSGDPVRVVAYVVGSPEFNGAALARALRREHEGTIVPNLWIPLPTIPRRADGSALVAQLVPPHVTSGTTSTGWGHPLARQLATVWAETLGTPPNGPEEDFFDAGGHSLLASRLVARLRGPPFSVAVSLSSFFAAPTIAGLLALVQEARRSGDIVAQRRDSQEIRAAIDNLPAEEVDRLLHELGGLVPEDSNGD